MNEMLATTLVTNLLKNAFVHNTDGGRIVVTFAADRFTIGNTGVDTPLDATRIFEPFYKGSKQEGSTGLGLSIADGICKLIVGGVHGDPDGKILGCHLLGPHASDLIMEAAAMISCGATLRTLESLSHPHPTLSEIFI